MAESQARARADRIREKVPIVSLLEDYGYRVRSEGGSREQQFSCNLHGDGFDNKPSARVYPDSGSWYCVATSERVLTSKGWVPLGVLSGGLEEVLDGSSTWANPNVFLPRGVREVVKVKTRAGYAVTVTPEHEIEVCGRGWVQAVNLHPGDVLVVLKPETSRFGPSTPLPVDDLNELDFGHHPKLNLPTSWSQELGEVLGYVFGDGYVVPRQYPHSSLVGVTTHSSDVADVRLLFRYMREWASGRGSESHRTDSTTVHGKRYQQDQYTFSIGNNGFYEFFVRLGLDKSSVPARQRRLPESIWGAPRCGVRGFLRGVFGADGSVYRPKDRKGVRVTLSSVSNGFLFDVQLLLLQFGIYSRVHPPSNIRLQTGVRKGRRTHPAGYLQLATGKDILRFRELVGITNTRKKVILDSYEYNPRGSRPFKAVVESVTPAGQSAVADLSLPGEHSFVAGGIKVHNCFACDVTRDAIGTVQANEGIEFWDAVKWLEAKYKLPHMRWDGPREVSTLDTVSAGLRHDKTFEDDFVRVTSRVERITAERALPLRTILAFWEALDKVSWHVRGPRGQGGPWPEQQGRAVLVKLQERMLKAMRSHEQQDPSQAVPHL